MIFFSFYPSDHDKWNGYFSRRRLSERTTPHAAGGSCGKPLHNGFVIKTRSLIGDWTESCLPLKQIRLTPRTKEHSVTNKHLIYRKKLLRTGAMKSRSCARMTMSSTIISCTLFETYLIPQAFVLHTLFPVKTGKQFFQACSLHDDWNRNNHYINAGHCSSQPCLPNYFSTAFQEKLYGIS